MNSEYLGLGFDQYNNEVYKVMTAAMRSHTA
jgi:hypothetical protein